MAEEKSARAQKVYKTLCATLESHDWKYKRDDYDLSIECGAQGDDLPMDISVKVETDRQLIMLLSHLPFVIPEEKRLDAAIAISIINNMLIDGSFDYDIVHGHILFRMTSSFIESEISSDLFTYMLMGSCYIIDEYNDKLLMLGKGMITIEKFISNISNN